MWELQHCVHLWKEGLKCQRSMCKWTSRNIDDVVHAIAQQQLLISHLSTSDNRVWWTISGSATAHCMLRAYGLEILEACTYSRPCLTVITCLSKEKRKRLYRSRSSTTVPVTFNNACFASSGAHGLARQNLHYTEEQRKIWCMWTICTKAQKSVSVMYIVQQRKERKSLRFSAIITGAS